MLVVALLVGAAEASGTSLLVKQYFSCEGENASRVYLFDGEKDAIRHQKKESMIFFRYNVPADDKVIKGILELSDSGKFEVCSEEAGVIFFHRYCFHEWPEPSSISSWYSRGHLDKVTGRLIYDSRIIYKEPADKGQNGIKLQTESMQYQCSALNHPVVKWLR